VRHLASQVATALAAADLPATASCSIRA